MTLTPSNSMNVQAQIHMAMYIHSIFFIFNEPKAYDVLKMGSYSHEIV